MSVKNSFKDAIIVSLVGSLGLLTCSTALNKPLLEANNQVQEVQAPRELINDSLINKIIEIESNGNQYAVSHKGARGLMQLKKGAWKDMGGGKFNEAFNPNTNKEVGIKYLYWLQNYCQENHNNWALLPPKEQRKLIAAAYNGGPVKLRSRGWEVNRMPRETRNYVSKLEKIGAFD